MMLLLFIFNILLLGFFSHKVHAEDKSTLEIKGISQTIRKEVSKKLASSPTQYYTYNYFVDNTCSSLSITDSIAIGQCYLSVSLKSYMFATQSSDGTSISIQYYYDPSCKNNTKNPKYVWPVKSGCSIGGSIATSPVPASAFFTSYIGVLPSSYNTGILQRYVCSNQIVQIVSKKFISFVLIRVF